jgi:hypothetical protein
MTPTLKSAKTSTIPVCLSAFLDAFYSRDFKNGFTYMCNKISLKEIVLM